MTPNEHDNPETSVERETTEFYPFAAGPHREVASQPADWMPDWQPPDEQAEAIAADEMPPDLPVMEQLPDASALPDPGYPQMPAPAPPASPASPASPAPVPVPASASAPAPAPAPPDFGSGQVELPPVHDSAAPYPLPAGSGEVREYEQPGTYQSAQRSVSPRPTWTPEPYVAPRAPAHAPPLQGPAVPWSEVRAGPGHHQAGEPLPAPPAVREPAAGGARVGPDVPFPRETADALTSGLLLPGKRATPDGGWRRTVYRASGGLIRVRESAASIHRRDLIDRVRTPIAGGHHRVAVLSLKGGVGKTTVTVGLGSTLASLRGDRVIAVDGNPDRGTLSDKVRLQSAATIRDLLAERTVVRRYADIRKFTSQALSRLEILASDRDPGVSVAFSADDYRSVVAVLDQFYSICITDCGTGLLHSAMAGILELADQIVLVSSPSVDGARSASATLDWLDAHAYGHLVLDGVVALSSVRRKSKSTVDLNRLEQHFAARCRAVVRIPYDPHLEEGAEVELELLNEDTADAYLTLAALVADGFAQPRRSASGDAPGPPFAYR